MTPMCGGFAAPTPLPVRQDLWMPGGVSTLAKSRKRVPEVAGTGMANALALTRQQPTG